VASPNSVKLFTAWAAKHKEVIAIEDRWNIAVRDASQGADAIRLELERARDEAQQMLAQAQSLFHEELRARGLRE
jgi:S-ribosylhomocysteine lyase LuxS involved in autoinducer biosynthesis